MAFSLSRRERVGVRGLSRRTRLSANAAILAAALAVAAAFVSIQLFVPPVVGLPDNGDYQRVMGYAGFRHTTDSYAERYFSFLRTRYAIAPPGWFRSGYHSSETVLAFAARSVHLAFSNSSIFDIRLLGAIHAALLLVALAGLIRACRDLAPATQAVAAILLVLVFTDVGYVAPFNSFYSQTASLLFLLLTVAVAAEAVRRGVLAGGWVLAYFGCALLFVCSKPQEKLAAPLLAIYGLRLAGVRFAGAWRRAAVWLAIGLCAFSVWYGKHTPYSLREASVFQVVFDDLLGHSPTPAADAARLGLDPDWVKYAGTSPYAPDSPLHDPEFRVRFLQRIGYRRILGFYLSHPARLIGRIERESQAMWTLRPDFGNFERSPEHPDRTLATRFSLWSGMRHGLAGRALFWAAILFAGSLAAAVATYPRAGPRGRLFREGIVVLVLVAGLAFAVCTLAQVSPDPTRSLYAFQAICDLLLIANAAWLAEALATRLAG
jgi:hypothetical protein